MPAKRTFLKFSILLACLCFIFAISSNFVKIENTKAYVFSLSDKCVNTFTGDISDITTEPSTEPSTEPTTKPLDDSTTKPMIDEPSKTTTESTTGEKTTRKINKDKVSPPTGNTEATLQLFIILPFAAIIIVSIGIRKSRHT